MGGAGPGLPKPRVAGDDAGPFIVADLQRMHGHAQRALQVGLESRAQVDVKFYLSSVCMARGSSASQYQPIADNFHPCLHYANGLGEGGFPVCSLAGMRPGPL